jgi:competence protein ComEC
MWKILRIIIILTLIFRAVYICFFTEKINIQFPPDNVTISGYVDDYPEERISSNRYRFKITEFNNQKITDNSRILLVTNPYIKDISYGSKLNLIGSIENPKDFITDSGKSFDYDNYLALDNIYGIMRDPEIKIISGSSGNWLKNILFKIRSKFSKTLNKNLNENSSVLTKGILLGEKSGITDETRNNLAKTSTSHIIALSGYNITIVSEIIIQLTKGFSLFTRSILGSSSILLFVILAGGGSSANRAMIMAFILLYARYRGKNYNALWALILAFSIIVAINPMSFRYDMGLHLSVLATFGLIIFQTPIASYFIKKHLHPKIADILASTISASIMTLPYIAYNMGIISFIGIFANLLVVPLLPPLMLFSFIVGLIGQFSNILVLPFVYITHLLSGFILFIINIFGELPFSAIYKENIPLVGILLVYGIIFYYAFRVSKKETTLPQ